MSGRHDGRSVAGRLGASVIVIGVLFSPGAGAAAAGQVGGAGRAGGAGGAAAADGPDAMGALRLWTAAPGARPCPATQVGAEVRRCRYVSFDARRTLNRFVTPANLANARIWPVVTAVWSTADNAMISGGQVDPADAAPVPATVDLDLFDETVVSVRTGQITTQRGAGQVEVRWQGGIWRGGQKVAVTELRYVVRGTRVQTSADIAVDGTHYRLVPAGSVYRLDELDPQVWAGPLVAVGSSDSGSRAPTAGQVDPQVIKVTVPGSTPLPTTPPSTEPATTPPSSTSPTSTSPAPTPSSSPSSSPNPTDSSAPPAAPAPPGPRPGRTPTTGGDVAGMALTGFGLIVGGAVLALLGRRRRAGSGR